jgi:hypothetical protein
MVTNTEAGHSSKPHAAETTVFQSENVCRNGSRLGLAAVASKARLSCCFRLPCSPRPSRRAVSNMASIKRFSVSMASCQACECIPGRTKYGVELQARRREMPRQNSASGSLGLTPTRPSPKSASARTTNSAPASHAPSEGWRAASMLSSATVTQLRDATAESRFNLLRPTIEYSTRM